jgi:hypothetical protein
MFTAARLFAPRSFTLLKPISNYLSLLASTGGEGNPLFSDMRSGGAFDMSKKKMKGAFL